MSSPSARVNEFAPAIGRSPATAGAQGAIGATHCPLDEATVSAFSRWIDVELAQLESSFAAFTTGNSLKGSLGR